MTSPLSRAARAALVLGVVAAAAMPASADDGTGAVDAGVSGWVAASSYLRPNADEPLAGAGLRGAFAVDGYAFDAVGFRLAAEGYSNLAGLGDAVDWGFSYPDPLSVVATGNGRLVAALDIKEAWLDFALGDLDARIGKQVLAWGLADGNNPTDTVCARRVGTRLVSTLDEQRMGSIAANLVYNLPGNLGTVQGLFMPVSVPNDMASMAMDLTIPGVMRLVIEDGDAPELELANVEGGLRALFYAGNLSFSASWLSYLDRYPDFTSTFVPGALPLITLTPFHGRVNQFGADAAWLSGGYDLRTEWALSLTEDMAGDDPLVKNPSLSGVVQGSRSFLDGVVTASLAWAPRFVFGHEAATPGGTEVADMMAEHNGQAYAFEQTGSVRVAGKFLGETLQPEAILLASLEARDWLATLSATYNVADGVNLKGGLGFYGSFRAPDDPEREWGLFSNERTVDNDYLYVELRVSY